MTRDQFAAFCERLYPAIQRYCRWKCPGLPDAEDVVQDVFMYVASRAHALDDGPRADHYLWKAARVRACAARSLAAHRLAAAVSDPTNALLLATSPTPRLDHLVLSDLAVDDALSTLPPRQREVIESTVLEDRPCQALAARWGVTEKYISEIRQRALLALAHHYLDPEEQAA